MAGWLENLAKLTHEKFHIFASILVLALGAFLISDSLSHWLEGLISFDRIGGLGKSVGKGAYVLGFVAILYYGVRESYLMARKRQVTVSPGMDSLVKYWISVLRFAHPLIGVVAFSVVMLHGYILWRIWAGGNFSFVVDSGLVAGAVLLVVAVSGLCVRLLPKLIQFRYAHRLAGIAFVLSFIVHKIIAD